MKNVSHLDIKFCCHNPFMTGFEAALKKMPKLKVIGLCDVGYSPHVPNLILCESILIAALRRKEVIVEYSSQFRQQYFYGQLKIVKKGNTKATKLGDEKCETFIIIRSYLDRRTYEKVKTYLLENNLRNYKMTVSIVVGNEQFNESVDL